MLTLTPPDPDYSISHLIHAYLTVRSTIETMQKTAMLELQKSLEPYQKELTLFENALNAALLQLGPEEGKRSIRTSLGTVYRQRVDRYAVKDRDEWLSWVVNTESVQMITNHLSSEALKEHMAEHNGQLPPGISLDSHYEVRVRKA